VETPMTDQPQEKTTKPSKLSYLSQGWLVLVLATCFGGLLAFVESNLKPKIESNKSSFAMSAIPEIVPGCVKGEAMEHNGQTIYRAVDAGGGLVGWVLAASGDGFADRIEILIGLDRLAQQVTGLKVLSQKETPGLGAKIEKPDDFALQFASKSAELPIGVTKSAPSGNQVGAITGATVSSEAVANILNAAVQAFRNDLPMEAR